MSLPGRDRGQYRIQTVSEMTGIPAATLRAWERRYGIPSPERTRAAYRLYSDEDVDLIRRLRELTEQGTAPAEAARLLLSEGAAPARIEADPWESAVDRIEAAVDRFDPDGVEDAVRDATVLGSAVQVFDKIIGPAQRRIGDRWHAGTLTVAQEHLCSEILAGVTRDLLRLVQPEEARRTILLACLADEEHALPLLGAAFRFAGWGFRTVVLGARTPPEALATAVERLDPDVVGLSATTSVDPPHAQRLVAEYARAIGDRVWVVGGLGAGPLLRPVEEAGGLAAGDDATELRGRIEAALAARRRR